VLAKLTSREYLSSTKTGLFTQAQDSTHSKTTCGISSCILHDITNARLQAIGNFALNRDAVILRHATLESCVQVDRRRVQVIGPGRGSVDQQNGNALFIDLLVSVDVARGGGVLTSMTASSSSMTVVTGWLMMGILRRMPALSIKISCNALLAAANWVGERVSMASSLVPGAAG
jgi:hypothetical protein